MPLSAEDSLRLNVMLANKPLAIRIEESRMQVWSLNKQGEARIDLCPNCRDEPYLKQVRELLSGHILGSPGGYPVYIKRWTRMGQMRDESLEHLLLLGESEAVVAAVYAEGISDEIARRAWWVMEDAENARQMLGRKPIVNGQMGPILANWLIEFLPFETEAEKMMDTVRLVLQGDMISVEQRDSLWKKAKRRPAYYAGFLATNPDRLPAEAAENPVLPLCGRILLQLAEHGNRLAGLLHRVLGAPGQAWLQTLEKLLEKPANQDVVNTALDITADYFSAARAEGQPDMTMEELLEDAEEWLNGNNPEVEEILASCPDLASQLLAARVLSGMSYGVVRPVFRSSTAIGSLMRKKLAPLFERLFAEIQNLRK